MINIITIIIPDSKIAEGLRFNKITARKSKKTQVIHWKLFLTRLPVNIQRDTDVSTFKAKLKKHIT